MSIVRAATWSLSVLLRGMPPVDFELYVSEKWLDPCQVKIALPALQRLIHATDEDVLTDTCWTLAYLSEGHMDNIQAIIELGVCPKLVQLLQYPSDGVILPALLALGNIAVCGGAHTQILPSSNSIATKKTQLLIDNQLLPCLRQLLEREYTRFIFKEASWIIAFITSGTPAHVQVRKANGSPSPYVFSRKNQCPVKKVDRRV
ncbi:importin subunit alpha-1a-like [Vigna umbellata]|uniref:importin subunit alpha-1a-like n=1 Tax=Vigna umbellata TaxID=87088 RepID=UPI001F5F2549|nr:importin subunit alpha-1a-like [Vigna umbellata]